MILMWFASKDNFKLLLEVEIVGFKVATPSLNQGIPYEILMCFLSKFIMNAMVLESAHNFKIDFLNF